MLIFRKFHIRSRFQVQVTTPPHQVGPRHQSYVTSPLDPSSSHDHSPPSSLRGWSLSMSPAVASSAWKSSDSLSYKLVIYPICGS